MPSKSPAQHRLMEAVAHNPAFAKKVGIPQSVGREFANADKRKESKRTLAGKHKRPRIHKAQTSFSGDDLASS